MSIDKVVASPAQAIADIEDGASIVTAGFGLNHGFAASLLVALRERGTRRLEIIANSLGEGPFRAQSLIENHQVDRLVVSFSGRAGRALSAAERQIESGEISLELVPQGTLVERLRAGGAGIGAIYTRTGIGTAIAEGKEIRHFDGVPYVLERALRADFAFIRALRGDRFGNLEFRGVGRNFNPSFAKSARVAIAEVDEVVSAIEPERVGLPGIFVDRVVVRTEFPAIEAPNRAGREDDDQARSYLGKPGWTRSQVAEIAAGQLPEPSYVNLGLGMPTLISDYVRGRDIVLHAENGILGYSDLAGEDNFDPDLYNAGSQYVTVAEGASYFDSVTSFEMLRGGRVDVVVLGAFQVDEQANLANWTAPPMVGGAIGGAMDLVSGGAQVMVLMSHCESNGRPKLVRSCSLPVTGTGCVDVVVTDLAVLRREDGRFLVERVAPGFEPAEIAELVEMDLVIPGTTGQQRS